MLPPLNTWRTSPVFVPAGCPFGSVAGHQHHATIARREVADPDIIIAVDVQAPRDVDRPVAGVAHAASSWVPSGRIMLMTPVDFGYFKHGLAQILNCSMMDAPSGTWASGSPGTIARHPDILLGVQRQGADADAAAEGLHLRRIVAGNRTTVSDCELLTQTRFWESMTISKGDFSPATLTMRPSFIRPPGKYSN